MAGPTVIIVGFLDTKYEEHAFVHDILTRKNCDVVTIDVSIQTDAEPSPDTTFSTIPVTHTPADVCEAASTTLSHIRSLPRAEALTLVSRGAESLVQSYLPSRVHAIFSLGGSTSTSVTTAIMRHPAVPVGLPKVCVSTMANAGTKEYVGDSDLVLMPAIVDFPGTLNTLSRRVLGNAANAVAGMAWGYLEAEAETQRSKTKEIQTQADTEDGGVKLVAVTMFGLTTPGVTAACDRLRAHRHPSTGKSLYEPVVFHATGEGGRVMERLVREGWFVGVLDITTTELADELCGGILSAGPDRLTAAPSRRTPTVVSLGALDMANFGPRSTVPERYASESASRTLHVHNDSITLLRTSPAECTELGATLARKLRGAADPTKVTVIVPLGGWSGIDIEGGPFWDPDADAACVQALKKGFMVDKLVCMWS